MSPKYANLREYLTLQNPKINASKLPKHTSGSTVGGSGAVGPHKTVLWTDFCLHKMEKRIAQILDQTYEFEAEQVSKIPNYSLKPLEEQGLQWEILKPWVGHIIEEAIKVTAQILQDEDLAFSQEDWAFSRGRIHCKVNTGEAHIRRTLANGKKLKPLRPDWHCCQCSGEDLDSIEDNVPLMYGDTKTSGSFKSEWIDSESETSRIKAQKTLEQITRYMEYNGLQYGFIITDAEVVALKLSKYPRRSRSRRTSTPAGRARPAPQVSIVEASRSSAALQNLQELTGSYTMHKIPNFKAKVHDRRDIETTSPNGSYPADATVDVYMQHAAVSWDEYGTENLTVNSVIWWLIMLATEDPLMVNHLLKESSSNLNSQEVQSPASQANPQHDGIQSIEGSPDRIGPAYGTRARRAYAAQPGQAKARATPKTTRSQPDDEIQEETTINRRRQSSVRKRLWSQASDIEDGQQPSTRRRPPIGSYVVPTSDDDENDVLYTSFSRQNSGIQA